MWHQSSCCTLINDVICLLFSVSEPSGEEDTIEESPSTKVKYNRLCNQEMPQQICGYDISPSLSTSSEDSTPISTFQFSIVQKPGLNDFFLKNKKSPEPPPPTAFFALNRRICNDLRLSANKSFSQNIRPSRPYLPPRRVDGTTYDNRNSFEKRITTNRFSEKRQSDPQIRYAFYNKGFEVATSSKHRKYSLSHNEIRRKAMPDIDEYGSMENEDSSDEWPVSRHLQYYSGSSGRDITLLPKLKIRICDEMGARIKHSFDESSFSDENFNANNSSTAQSTNTNESNEEIPNCEQHKSNDPVTTPSPPLSPSTPSSQQQQQQQLTRIESVDNDASVCKKCGHKLKLPKQFTNAFA